VKFKKLLIKKVNEVLEKCGCTEIKNHDHQAYWISAKHPERGLLYIGLPEEHSCFKIQVGPMGQSEEVRATFTSPALDKVVREMKRFLS